MNIEPFVEKWKSFGWNVSEVDGHNFSAIIKSLEGFAKMEKPSALICHTVKGKGVSFMENSVLWHYRSPQGEEYEEAISEVETIDLPIEKLIKRLKMRDSFITELKKYAENNEKIILITADLGFKIFDDFKEDLPNQFINVGVAEQNMTEVASGLALEGFKVFTYSIGNFSTLRCLEQIRNDICYHDLDVTVVSSGAGFSYGQLGISHFATEDLAIMSALPNMSVLRSCR